MSESNSKSLERSMSSKHKQKDTRTISLLKLVNSKDVTVSPLNNQTIHKAIDFKYPHLRYLNCTVIII